MVGRWQGGQGAPLYLGSSNQMAALMLTQNGHLLGEREPRGQRWWEVMQRHSLERGFPLFDFSSFLQYLELETLLRFLESLGQGCGGAVLTNESGHRHAERLRGGAGRRKSPARREEVLFWVTEPQPLCRPDRAAPGPLLGVHSSCWCASASAPFWLVPLHPLRLGSASLCFFS